MSVQIKDLPCPYCSIDCQHMQLEIESDNLYNNDKIVERCITLSCRNEGICQMWNKAKEQI